MGSEAVDSRAYRLWRRYSGLFVLLRQKWRLSFGAWRAVESEALGIWCAIVAKWCWLGSSCACSDGVRRKGEGILLFWAAGIVVQCVGYVL